MTNFLENKYLLKDHKTNMWYRPEKGELHVLREQSQYKNLDFKDKKVMDVGANIGAFCHLALTNGAAEIEAYEPTPETFDLLTHNMDHLFNSPEEKLDPKTKCTIENVALVNEPKEETIDFYLSKKFPSCHTTVPVRGREVIQVRCLDFWKQLDDFKPDILKIDIEGGEYNLFLENKRAIPDYIEQIAIELHMSKKGQKDQACQIATLLENWHVHRKFRFNWHVTTLVLHRTKNNLGTVKQWMKK